MGYVPQSRHYGVLKQLFPLPLGGDLDADLDIEGLALDRAEDQATRLHKELFPDTATSDPVLGSLADWERVYGITPDPGMTDQQRAGVVVAKIRAGLTPTIPASDSGGVKTVQATGTRLCRAQFYSIAQALGYSTDNTQPKWILIEDGLFRPFRVGVGKVGDPVYFNDPGTSMFTVRVTGTGVESDANLQAAFSDQGSPKCDWLFVNA